MLYFLAEVGHDSSLLHNHKMNANKITSNEPTGCTAASLALKPAKLASSVVHQLH